MGAELLKTVVTDRDALNIIEMLESSSQRGSDLVKHVLAFARGVKGEASMLDVKPYYERLPS